MITAEAPLNVVVLVPTFGRPDMLMRCLDSIARQNALAHHDYRISVIVGDNNLNAGAHAAVQDLAAQFPIPLSVIHVAEGGLCYNRNALTKAALAVSADMVVLIDDDEWAEASWLGSLLMGMSVTGADAMVGPVETIFHSHTPDWLRHSGIIHNSTATAGMKTGAPSRKLATHNTIIRAEIFRKMPAPWFPLELNRLGSEDQAFFWRARALGYTKILWCAEAHVREEMPLSRADRRYFIRRCLQWGTSVVIASKTVRLLHPGKGPKAPWRETLRQTGRLILGLPLLLGKKSRPRVYRQALYVYGRILGHLGLTIRFYGR